MPDALRNYWTMWNEPDVEAVRGHLDLAVTADFVFADPMHFHIGRDALEQNVRQLRTSKPRYRFVIASELDAQNHCYRYEWRMMAKHRVLMRGFDFAQLDDSGLLRRVDGFFGELRPVDDADSHIPDFLRSPDPGSGSGSGIGSQPAEAGG
ncbi:MAG: nuclear transport factor 2 family protein [Acidimicrobiales bacterium]